MAKKDKQQQQPAAQAAPQAAKVPFDAWHAMVQKKIPSHHRKEIILADFKARGLSMEEPMAVFNKALELYGIKLK